MEEDVFKNITCFQNHYSWQQNWEQMRVAGSNTYVSTDMEITSNGTKDAPCVSPAWWQILILSQPDAVENSEWSPNMWIAILFCTELEAAVAAAPPVMFLSQLPTCGIN